MYNLFLDDIRTPKMAYSSVRDSRYNDLLWVTVRDYSEFVSYITSNGLPSLISFDHDLDISNHMSEEKTGYDCAKWLVEYCMDNSCSLPDYLVHSMNPVGKANIIGLFQSFNRRK